MNARILTTATLTVVFSTALPAADPQLVNLLMPNAKVLAGVNVAQAKASPFGQFVLSQMASNDQQMQELVTLTGFDPTRDVQELLVATDGDARTPSGLALARGTFNVGAIMAFATQHEAVTENYGGSTILEDPKKTHGIAFLNSTLVAAGDIANVKAAIDRQSAPSSLSPAVAAQLNQWSTTEDAWAISTVPPTTLHPGSGTPQVPGIGANGQNAFQNIQTAAGGVKFGATVVLTAQAQADNAQDASSMKDALTFLVNLAQMQAGSNNQQAAALLQALAISTSNSTLNISLSLPADQFQQLVNSPKQTVQPRRMERRK